MSMSRKFHVYDLYIPAYFCNSRREATKDAGVIPGLNVMQIINEPIAAALTYGLHTSANCVENRNIFICDIGGGTFGASLITLKGDKFEIKATAETKFGGEDSSDRMVNHFVKEFKRRHGIEVTGNSRAHRRLRILCERAKRTLSYRTEQLDMDLFEKCMNTVESCLTNAKIDTCSEDDVILVGGSSKIPNMQNLLQDFFKKRVKLFDHDEAVAYGAAIQAASLSGGLKNVPKNVHQYLTRMSLAAEPILGKIVINKKVNVTIEDNKSSVMIDFQEGAGMTVSIPGSYNISLPDPAFELPINICFAADFDSMLNVSAEVQTVSKDIIITNENVRLELRNRLRKLCWSF
ncbi:heat shock protein [Trifolium pratense]|uniref:Heat shock protein n=1 Tax=Trifolium pratense TaxID=57577 RepID=A0A2K3NHF7_TRIPR|nr:heat shock protein [Trifolium pratense]